MVQLGMATTIVRQPEKVFVQDTGVVVQKTSYRLDIGHVKICGPKAGADRDAHRTEDVKSLEGNQNESPERGNQNESHDASPERGNQNESHDARVSPEESPVNK